MSPAVSTFDAGRIADDLIAGEVAIQDKMWGVSNDRADVSDLQMLRAAMASLDLTFLMDAGKLESHTAVKLAKADFYPEDWDGFRDYGNLFNLVVASAYLRSEIKRRIAAGEDYTRKPRQQPYAIATPNMSSAEAANGR